ncbi:hypothetical protein V5O48_012785 [Marasmius crinis-equi]|uniref:Transmembrane protein n=1 Tax=Marasmius crinis-equi TaxID=585013 RepID=A0ABR3F1V7_9AGAR
MLFASFLRKQQPQAEPSGSKPKIDIDIPTLPAKVHLRRWESTTSTELDDSQTQKSSRPSTSEKEAVDPLPALFFKYGFFFPLFWVFGALILRHPFSSDASAHPEDGLTKSEVEMVERIRQDERKWGKRCLWALVTCAVLLVLGIVVGLSVGLTISRRR